jgi:hypothetical protein
MKYAIVLATALFALTAAAAETQKVCVDIKDKAGKAVSDPKTGKAKQNCKQVKQHKKLEGTVVPGKK